MKKFMPYAALTLHRLRWPSPHRLMKKQGVQQLGADGGTRKGLTVGRLQNVEHVQGTLPAKHSGRPRPGGGAVPNRCGHGDNG